MPDTTVHTPPREHHCRPGWTEYVIPAGRLPGITEDRIGLRPPGQQQHPTGTVVECDCGRTWVAYHHCASGNPCTQYRPETKRERRRREGIRPWWRPWHLTRKGNDA